MDRKRPTRHFSRIAFVGAGRAATALSTALASAGWTIAAVASRSPESAARLARNFAGCRVASIDDVLDGVDLCLLTVPDDALASVAASLPFRPLIALVHCAGSLGTDMLAPAASVGVWHPLLSLATAAPVITGCTFAIDASPPLDSLLRDMTESIGARAITLPAGSRPIYHAAAIFASNYVVALAAVAADLWQTIGFDRETATGAIAPLVASVAANLAEVGLPAALTGPVVRGDLATVDRHLTALASDPDRDSLYRALGRQLLPIAAERGLAADRLAALASHFASAGHTGQGGTAWVE